MIGFLLDPGMRPFAIAIGVVAGLLVLEIVLVLAGLSLTGTGGGGGCAGP